MEYDYPFEAYQLLNLKGRILQFIRHERNREPPLTAKDIQKEFNIGKSTASEHLTFLENLRLVERVREGKYKHIYPTDKVDLLFKDFFA